jgi:NAD(P)-dependent dehydrogenase (short-subunit alcohol dehydrogenase family)
MEKIAGSSILITGGGSGIGAGLARHLADQGAKVTICGRREAAVVAVAEDIGTNCIGVAADVTNADDRERLVARAVAHGGGLEALVNGAANMYRGPIEDLEEQKLLDVFHSNVIGPMLLSGLCAPHLEERQGAIILFGSVHVARAFPGASPYAATKGALETLTGVLAAELGSRQIRVSCVRPGAVFTEINQRAGLFDDETALQRLEGLAPAHALRRIGSVDDVSRAVEYLLLADWATGAVLSIDGGLSLGVTDA